MNIWYISKNWEQIRISRPRKPLVKFYKVSLFPLHSLFLIEKIEIEEYDTQPQISPQFLSYFPNLWALQHLLVLRRWCNSAEVLWTPSLHLSSCNKLKKISIIQSFHTTIDTFWTFQNQTCKIKVCLYDIFILTIYFFY